MCGLWSTGETQNVCSVSGEGTGGGDRLAKPSMVGMKLLLALFFIAWEGKGDYFFNNKEARDESCDRWG